MFSKGSLRSFNSTRTWVDEDFRFKKSCWVIKIWDYTIAYRFEKSNLSIETDSFEGLAAGQKFSIFSVLLFLWMGLISISFQGSGYSGVKISCCTNFKKGTLRSLKTAQTTLPGTWLGPDPRLQFDNVSDTSFILNSKELYVASEKSPTSWVSSFTNCAQKNHWRRNLFPCCLWIYCLLSRFHQEVTSTLFSTTI